MIEPFHTLFESGILTPCDLLMGAMVAALAMLTLHYMFKARRALPYGCVAIDKIAHERLKEENSILVRECAALNQELKALNSGPKPPLVPPVIDWAALGVVSVDREPDKTEVSFICGGESQFWHFATTEETHAKLCAEFREHVNSRPYPMRAP